MTQTKSYKTFSGIIFKYGVPNRNGLVHTREQVENAVEFFKKRSSMVGFIGQDFPTLNMDPSKISHIITDLYGTEDRLCGTIQCLTTPMGIIAAKMIDTIGYKCYLAARGSGIIDNGIIRNYQMFSIDLCSE